jgi:GAF domain-containing protein
MRRRSKAGGEPVKTRRRKTAARKRGNAPKVARHHSPPAGQETVARLTRERDEALEQLSAASQVLKVISSSPGDLKPVFETILANATRICEAKFGTLWLAEGHGLRAVALYNAPRRFADAMREALVRPNPKTAVGRVLMSKQPVQVADLATDAAYAEGDPLRVALVELVGARTLIVVPMLKNDVLVGAISIYRQEVRAFTEKQIALMQNFAAQAVIAVENTRLLNELRESLQQQTATSEVLQVISSSPGELQPVFDAMLANATRLCEASYGTMWLHESDGQMRVAVMHGNLPEAFHDKWRVGTLFQPSPSLPTARVFDTRKAVQVVDLKKDRSYFDRDALAVASVEVAGIRSLISVPMLKEGEVIGTLNVYRREVRPFTDKQIELVINFAAQAVIAIENTRLLNELRESLEQQTATSEVLRVISSSPSDLAPVFQTMLANATRLCDATFGTLLLYEGDWRFRVVAMSNVPPAFAELRQREPIFEVSPQMGLGRAVATKDVVHIADYAEQAILQGATSSGSGCSWRTRRGKDIPRGPDA